MAGVVRKIEIKPPKNPNKLGKQLAPWFTPECREAKRKLMSAKRSSPKGSVDIVDAAREYR